jgi:hypothetical protein
MPKNAHLHIVVNTEFLNSLKSEAKNRMISLSEFCRLKLKDSIQMDRIEYKIDKLIKDGNK